MDQMQLVALTLLAVIGIVATVAILGRSGRAANARQESPFAASSEGETRCPNCAMGNLSTDDRCVSCGAKL